MLLRVALITFTFCAGVAVAQGSGRRAEQSPRPVDDGSPKQAAQKTKQQADAVKELKKLAESVPTDSDAMVHALVYGDVASAIEKQDKKSSVELFTKAIEAGIAAPEDQSNDTENLITPYVWELTRLDPDAALRIAERNHLAPHLRGQIIQTLLSGGNAGLEKAKTLLLDAPQKDLMGLMFVANEVVGKLPEDDPDRMEIWRRASLWYSENDKPLPPGYDDFVALLKAMAPSLPRATVLATIDTVLEGAKTQDEKHSYQIMQAAPREDGSLGPPVVMDSAYEYRLVQLLPLVEKIDPDRAEKLKEEDARLAGLSHALNSGGSRPMTLGVASGSNGTVRTDVSSAARFQAAQKQMKQLLADDPQQALSYVMTQPDEQKLTLLFEIEGNPGAGSVKKKAAQETIAAAERIIKSDVDASIKVHALQSALQLANVFKSSDPEFASDVCGSLLKLTEQMAEQDGDLAHPNLASKVLWPSTVAYERLVERCSEVRPEVGDAVLAGIDDETVKLLIRISQLSATLGSKRNFSIYEVKSERSGSVRTSYGGFL